MTTIRKAQSAINKAGIPVELVRGEGYHYFIHDVPAQNIFETVSIYTLFTKDYTPAGWADLAETAYNSILSTLEMRA
jgi:hypothetical protein